MNIIILDDHILFSQGIGRIISGKHSNTNIKIYNSIQELKNSIKRIEHVDILITDMELPNEDIFGFIDDFKNQFPSTPILAITMHNKFSVIKKCREKEIEGYILKDESDLLFEAIEALLNKQNYYSKKVQQTINNVEHINDSLLTGREEQVLKLISEGMDIESISKSIFLSPYTVQTHIKNIKNKLNLSKSNELIIYYHQNYI